MRCILILIAALAIPAVAQSPIPPRQSTELDPARIAAIEELILLTDVVQMQREAMPRLQADFIGQFGRRYLDALLKPIEDPKLAEDRKEFEQQVASLIAERVDFRRSIDLFVKMYAEVFTPEEIDGMVAFYSSPVGRSVHRKASELATRGLALAQQKINDAMPDIQKMTMQWVETMKKKYAVAQ